MSEAIKIKRNSLKLYFIGLLTANKGNTYFIRGEREALIKELTLVNELINELEQDHNCKLSNCTIEIQEDLKVYQCGNVYTTELNKYFCYCRNHDCSTLFLESFKLCNPCEAGECITCTNCKRDEFNAITWECNGCGEPDHV